MPLHTLSRSRLSQRNFLKNESLSVISISPPSTETIILSTIDYDQFHVPDSAQVALVMLLMIAGYKDFFLFLFFFDVC